MRRISAVEVLYIDRQGGMVDSAVIAGLDIGTDRIRVLIAEYDSDGKFLVSGWGESRSEGTRRGVVVNIEAAREAILTAIEAAEQEAGRTVTELLVALGGPSVSSLNSRGVVPVSGKNREIRAADVERVLEAARAVVIPMDRDILHILPQEYIIDDQRGVRNPIDMIGIRLEAEVHIVTASVSVMKNMEKAMERAEYKIRDMVLGTLATARASLSDEEKEMGVLLMDIGTSSTDYISVYGGAPRVTGSVPFGGTQATSDLSIVLKIPMEWAERIKCELGCCWESLVREEENAIVPGIGGRKTISIPASDICRILKPRVTEIFMMVKRGIEKSVGLIETGAGIVLAGGGALLPGITDLAESVFGQPVRVANPKSSVSWPNPCCDTRWTKTAGLILLGDVIAGTNKGREVQETELSNPFRGLLKWLGEFF